MPFSAQHIKAARLHLMQADPVMKKVIKQLGPFTARMNSSPEVAHLESMPDQEAIEWLLDHGKSRLEAEEFLMFSLGRLDILPLSDSRLVGAIVRQYELDPLDNQRIDAIATKWKPYSTIAAWYLIASTEK